MDHPIYHFSSIDSTNTWAMDNVHLCPKEKITLVIADKQTTGKGRMNNRWHSSHKGNIYTSFCLFVPEKKGVQLTLTQVMALSVIQSIEETTGLFPKVKWPNDLLIHKKKVAGILTETKAVEGFLFHVIGVGINVNMSAEALSEIDQPATSLAFEKGVPIKDSLSLLQTLQHHFTNAYALYMQEGFFPFLEQFQHKLIHKPNQPVRFHEGGRLLEGLFHSLNEDGSFNLMLETGTVKRCVSGVLESADYTERDSNFSF